MGGLLQSRGVSGRWGTGWQRGCRVGWLTLWVMLAAGLFLRTAAQGVSRPVLQRELPREVFERLTEATVEGWIRFDAFAPYSRFFDVGQDRSSITVTHYERSPNLLFEAWESATNRSGIHVLGLLRTNEWCHLAAVVSPRGQRLYYNGRLIATNDSPIAFAQLKEGGNARLGRSVWEGSEDANRSLRGALAEVRLWSRERTAAEIERDLFSSLGSSVGQPDAPLGLVKVWGEELLRRSVDTDADRDLPEAEELAHPGIVDAEVRDEKGQPVNLAQVRIRSTHRRILAAGRTGTAGYWMFRDVAGSGRFTAAIYEPRTQFVIEVFSPLGSITVRQPSLPAGEHRHLTPVLPQDRPSATTTNWFVRELVGDLHSSDAWLRENAALDLGNLGDFPNAAAALASTFALDPDPIVREHLRLTLNKLSLRSPIAVAALLETPGTAEWFNPEAIQQTLRQQPVPAALQTVYTRRTQAVALLFAGILGAFSALHLFVFLYDRRRHTDGLYALFTAMGAVGTLLNDLGRVDGSLWYRWLGPACLGLSLSLALRLLYAMFTRRIPLRFWVLNGLFFLCGVKLLMFNRQTASRDWEFHLLQFTVVVTTLLVLAEMLRVAWRAYWAGKSGARLIGGGLVVFAFGQLLAPFSAPIFLNDVWAAWLFPLSMTIFGASASLYLAREFVRTNRALQTAHLSIKSNQERLTAEIAEAASYVRSLLPTPWTGPDISTAWAFQPSMQLGGDAFGHHRLDAHRTAFYLLDACGHGVGAALLSVSALNLLRSEALADTDFTNPADVLHELNRRFPMEAHGGQYFTAWYGVFDQRDRSLTYSSAGHPPSYVLAGNAPPVPLRTHGSPVGCMPNARYENARTLLPSGADLLLISDGVFELQRPDGGPMTLTDFERELAQFRWHEPEQILAWSRSKHGGNSLEDDFSVLRATLV